MASATTEIKPASAAFSFADLSSYSFKDRCLIRAAGVVFYLAIKAIGITLQIEVEGWENLEAASQNQKLPIYTTWHNRVLVSTFFWRHRRIVVMTSQSFDGEYIARFIQRFGFGAARGSSTRGGTGAFVQMMREMRAGHPAGFMIDGPKGPRYVAKMGAVLLAKKTGNPVLPISLTARKLWEVKSWDRLQVPKPFTSVRVYIAPPIFVPAEVDDEGLQAKRNELQLSLDEMNQRGEKWRDLS